VSPPTSEKVQALVGNDVRVALHGFGEADRPRIVAAVDKATGLFVGGFGRGGVVYLHA
jgi:hypothetical protein